MDMKAQPIDTVFLDRDGTVIEEREYLSDPDGVVLLPDAAAGLTQLAAAGKKLVILTNQSGIGRGYFTQKQSDAVQAKTLQLLKNEGVAIDGIYCCPHSPNTPCDCRKPNTGMARSAAQDLGLDLNRCAMIGDKAIDIAMGENIGAVTILVQTGYGKEELAKCKPDFVATSLLDAARFLLGSNENEN